MPDAAPQLDPPTAAAPAPPRPREEDEDERRFTEALDREILESERTRTTALAALFGFFFVFFVIATYTWAAEPFREVFRGRLGRPFVAAVLGGFALFELGARAGISRAIRQGRKPSAWLRYLSAFTEVSLPTFAVWYLGSNIFHPAEALLGPPVLLYFLFVTASVLRLEPAISLFTGAVATAQYIVLLAWAYSAPIPEHASDVVLSQAAHRGRAFFILTSGVVAALVAKRIRDHVLRNMLRAERERGHIFRVFGQHVSPQVVNRLLEQRGTELHSEVRYVCVMFLDIRDFTSFAERRRPEEVVQYLNAVLGYMIDVVGRHNGIVNKFLGDGFMAVFGAPISDGQECRNALAAAREILARTEAQDPALPPPRIGIGLHAGEAVTGHVGSADRKEYTIIGDVVNVASRIESLNKEFASQVLASRDVVEAAGEPAAANAVSRGSVKVKGRENAIEVFQLG